MPTFRVTWQFLDAQSAGWNEVYYKEASNLAGARPSLATIKARLNLLNSLNTLLRIRFAQADANRVTDQEPQVLFGTDVDSSGPAVAGDAVIHQLGAITGGTRKLWMRGCSARAFQRNPATGLPAFPSWLVNRSEDFYKALIADGFGLRLVQTQRAGPLQNIKITQVDGSRKDGTSDVTLFSPPGYPFPSRVIIGGTNRKDLPALNGRWSILKLPVANVVTIPYQTPEGNIIVGGNAHMRQEIFDPTHPFTL